MKVTVEQKGGSELGSVTLEQLITEETEHQLAMQQKQKRNWRSLPLVVSLFFDIVIAGVLLCVFALFHHVVAFSFQSADPVMPPSTDSGMIDSTEPEASPFTETVVMTDSSYSSKNVAITVEQHTKGEGDDLITYYVADVRVRSISCFRTAFAKDKYGQGIKEGVLSIAERNNAILATSGDYYGMHASKSVIRNGRLYRQKNGDEDVCVLYRNGTMKIFYDNEKFDAAAEVENGAWQAWSFGPSLFDKNGEPLASYGGYVGKTHPRCAIGYYESGHYALVLVDGRKEDYSRGMTIPELGELFKELGCTLAYNLDGGETAQMAFNGEIVNQPYKDGRDVSDILYITEVDG